MDSVVNFLRDIGVGNVGRFVARIPPILSYDVETELRGKINFLVEHYEGTNVDVMYELVRFPAFFSHPLERVKVRFLYLREKGIESSLHQILTGGDKDFERKFGTDFREWSEDFLAKAEKQ